MTKGGFSGISDPFCCVYHNFYLMFIGRFHQLSYRFFVTLSNILRYYGITMIFLSVLKRLLIGCRVGFSLLDEAD